MQIHTQETSPLVSVIIPAYNAEPFLRETIESVLSQTVSDWQMLVIDDGSSDNTQKIVTEFAQKDPRIQLVVNESNMGVAKTRNRGMELCRGKYVALLDSDDYWKPQLLEKMIARAEETGADIIYCSYEMVTSRGVRCATILLCRRKPLLKNPLFAA